MNTIIKLIFCLCIALSYTHIDAMNNKEVSIKQKMSYFISTRLNNAKLYIFNYTQDELNNMLIKATLIDPDHQLPFIQKLIAFGADVNAEIKNLTPLLGAIAGGYMGQNIKTVDLLLKSGANVTHATSSVGSPLTFAKISQNSDIVIALLNKAIEAKKIKDRYVQ